MAARIEALALIGRTMYRYRIVSKRSVAAIVATLEADPQIAAVQPNYLLTFLMNRLNAEDMPKRLCEAID